VAYDPKRFQQVRLAALLFSISDALSQPTIFGHPDALL
jgi:hypothetical protein